MAGVFGDPCRVNGYLLLKANHAAHRGKRHHPCLGQIASARFEGSCSREETPSRISCQRIGRREIASAWSVPRANEGGRYACEYSPATMSIEMLHAQDANPHSGPCTTSRLCAAGAKSIECRDRKGRTSSPRSWCPRARCIPWLRLGKSFQVTLPRAPEAQAGRSRISCEFMYLVPRATRPGPAQKRPVEVFAMLEKASAAMEISRALSLRPPMSGFLVDETRCVCHVSVVHDGKGCREPRRISWLAIRFLW